MARVLIVTTQLPELSPGGGIGSVNKRLALLYSEKGHQVDVLTYNTDRQITRNIRNEYAGRGINLLNIGRASYVISPNWLTSQDQISRISNQIKPDLVVAQEWQAPLSLTANFHKCAPGPSLGYMEERFTTS